MVPTYRRDSRLTIALNPRVNEKVRLRSGQFLSLGSEFKLGGLVTESSHPATRALSQVAASDIPGALDLLSAADEDVVSAFRTVAQSGLLTDLSRQVLQTIQNGGRIFFTGCGSTGRLSILLDSVWRDFWRTAGRSHRGAAGLEQRTVSVMAGGDYALIKSVEGFEDFTAFGRKQMQDLSVGPADLVFAITEGGETSFVIGTAWQGVDAGARVFFVYNNPDAILGGLVRRSREVLEDPRITKVNLTTGPMAITGSTRMQATSIQLCVLSVVLESSVRKLMGLPEADLAALFLNGMQELRDHLRSRPFREQLAGFVALEEKTYKAGARMNYFANRLGIDVLTDTTERSPTFCTPPFRKWGDQAASESWAYLFLPQPRPDLAWEFILQRQPRCIGWSGQDILHLVDPDKVERTREILRHITLQELYRHRIDSGGMSSRPMRPGDSAVAMVTARDAAVADFIQSQLDQAAQRGASAGCIQFGDGDPNLEVAIGSLALPVPVPSGQFLLDGMTHLAAKWVLNTLSTCTMVRLGRVMDNFMIWVVPSNLKLIDRATRYIQHLTGLDYPSANLLLFDVIDYVEPRMKSDQAYPPVVAMAVLRHRLGITNEQAEASLRDSAPGTPGMGNPVVRQASMPA